MKTIVSAFLLQAVIAILVSSNPRPAMAVCNFLDGARIDQDTGALYVINGTTQFVRQASGTWLAPQSLNSASAWAPANGNGPFSGTAAEIDAMVSHSGYVYVIRGTTQFNYNIASQVWETPANLLSYWNVQNAPFYGGVTAPIDAAYASGTSIFFFRDSTAFQYILGVGWQNTIDLLNPVNGWAGGSFGPGPFAGNTHRIHLVYSDSSGRVFVLRHEFDHVTLYKFDSTQQPNWSKDVLLSAQSDGGDEWASSGKPLAYIMAGQRIIVCSDVSPPTPPTTQGPESMMKLAGMCGLYTGSWTGVGGLPGSPVTLTSNGGGMVTVGGDWMSLSIINPPSTCQFELKVYYRNSTGNCHTGHDSSGAPTGNGLWTLKETRYIDGITTPQSFGPFPVNSVVTATVRVTRFDATGNLVFPLVALDPFPMCTTAM